MGLELKLEKMYCPRCLNLNDFDYIGMKLDKGNDITYYYNCRGCNNTASKLSIYSFDSAWRKVLRSRGHTEKE
jgi:transposase-like protein